MYTDSVYVYGYWLQAASRQSVGGEIYGVCVCVCVCVSAHAWGDGDGLVGHITHCICMALVPERDCLHEEL